MKKLLIAFLSVVLVLSMVGCGPKKSSFKTDEYTYVYQTDIDNLDYLVTDKATDNEHTVNFVEGLLETDRFGNYKGAGAESWESNEDATEWTFHIRQGIKWYTAAGEEYADYTAHDFVTALQHAADANSQTLNIVQSLIVGLDDYFSGKDKDFSKVGVKAVDDYTLVYTLTSPAPYFYTMGSYTILYPINEEFLNSKGAGCALGAYDKNTCEFGSLTPDSILYSGPYFLKSMDAKSNMKWEKNANYWDAENVHFNSVNYIYDDGSDVYSVIKGYEAGTYAFSNITSSWEDVAAYKEKYAAQMTQSEPDAYAFGINFNFNRSMYELTGHTTDADKENTRNAIMNENFRLAVQASFERVNYVRQSYDEEVAYANLRNMNGIYNLVSTTDGTPYGKLVEGEYKNLTGKDINLTDGQDPFFKPDDVMGYIEKAKAEGVTFPVSLDMLYINDDSVVYTNRANSIKESIEKNSQGNIIINAIGASKDTVQQKCFYREDASESDYDINTFSGWGPDYVDPKSFTDIYSVKNRGAYMAAIGLANDWGKNAASDAAAEKAGWVEYQNLIDAADAEKSNLDLRYSLYAKADAYLLAKGLFIPMTMQRVTLRVTKIVPYSAPYAVAGNSNYKLKFIQLQEEAVTKEQWQAAKEAWNKGE